MKNLFWFKEQQEITLHNGKVRNTRSDGQAEIAGLIKQL